MKRKVLLLAVGTLLGACSLQHKISNLRDNPVSAELSLPAEPSIPSIPIPTYADKDTLEVRDTSDVLIMNAVRDENGEMTATDVIRASTVTARFRNVAERHGKVDLQFQVRVPQALQDSKWQLRLNPDMFILEDSTRLEPVIITGADYRKRQLKGYERYQRFLDSIVSDQDKFIDVHQLEVFIKRNIPLLYQFRKDTSFVSEEEFASVYGVTEQAAIEHYTSNLKININQRRISKKDKMYQKYVKAPIVKEGIRLDTVILSPEGDFIYDYTQTIATCPKLRKADIKISGSILEDGNEVISIPPGQPLTFYISSLSAFTDMEERYLTKIISRKVDASTACYVDFLSASSDIDINLGNNRSEIGRIRKNLISLAADTVFEMDSIIVTASSSPEGLVKYNKTLSEKRAKSISAYLGKTLTEIRDSLIGELGFQIDTTGAISVANDMPKVTFISKSAGENWPMMDALIRQDTVLTRADKDAYFETASINDLDRREAVLNTQSYYRYLREQIYPKLRTVKFDFYLHRKGMVQDTMRTTVLDTTYMNGVKAIADRDYAKAISLLRPYGDYNLAVAYCAMDYNASALDILQKLEKTDKVHYMLAILYSRAGQFEQAVEHYKISCEMNPRFVHRGNLDPEISMLIKKYGLDKEN